MVYGQSNVNQVGKMAKRIKQDGKYKMVKNKVERSSKIICTLEIGTSIIYRIFVIECEEPYEARVSRTVL